MSSATASVKYEFDSEFQRKIAACVLKDANFNKRVIDLIKPEYFEKNTEAAIVNSTIRYFEKYQTTPSITVLNQLLKEDINAKVIRKDLLTDLIESRDELFSEDITDAEYISDQVAMFARHKAMENAAFEYTDLIDKKEYDKAAKVIADASNVSANEGEKEYDFFGDDEIDNRERLRNARLAGISTGVSISTGIRGLDKCLYHRGWGKKEFYVMMGPPKSGKSISLAYFAKNAALQGYNVLFATLEVSKDIAAERIDSSITGIAMDDLQNHIIEAKEKTIELKKKSGAFKLVEYPPGVMTPNMLSRLIQNFKSKGVIFDMVVVDYADIMAPNRAYNDNIAESKSIYIDLRAIAVIENVVMLSAMQTNREGAKAITSRMDHAAEDFNKVRIPDLVISINATDEEKARNEARLFFAASRNQAGNFSIFIKQSLEKMCFIESITKIE